MRPFRLMPHYSAEYLYIGGGRYHDQGALYSLWQHVGREVRGPRWLMECFYREFTAFWSRIVEWTEEGMNRDGEVPSL